jgi:drug/metabolite transporter (DMT)-like permease
MARQRAARRPDPQPKEYPAEHVITAGIGLWLLAFLVLVIFFRHDLSRHHTTYWLWICLTGVGLGIVGYPLVRRRKQTVEKDKAAGAARDHQPTG